MTQTRVIEVDPEKFDPGVLEPAAEAIREGGLVGMPTETVYGIAVNLERPEAVERLLEMRGSPGDKKITVHIGDRDHNDVRGPQALGMTAVLFTATRDADRATTTADAICESFADLPEILRALGARHE